MPQCSADGALSVRTASKVSQCWRPRKSPHRQCMRPLCSAIDPSSGCAWPPLVPREPSLLQAMVHPRLHQLAASAHVRTVVIDFCQYKTRWKKPTRLSFGNLDLQDVERFGKRRCLGRHRLCSRADCHTRYSQVLLPPGLCRDLGFVLASSLRTCLRACSRISR